MEEKLIYASYARPDLKDADTSGFRHREASRGVVVLPNGKLPIFLKSKIGQYKIPGGGKENDETPEETFVREVYEETGYTIKNIREIGYTLEVEDNYTQISHVFIADADSDTGAAHPDAMEIEQGGERLELTPEETLKAMRGFLDRLEIEYPDELPHFYFVTNRDYHILEHCLPLIAASAS